MLKRDALPPGASDRDLILLRGNDLYNDQEFENSILVGVPGAGWTDRHGWRQRPLARNAYAQLRPMLHPLVPNYCPVSAS